MSQSMRAQSVDATSTFSRIQREYERWLSADLLDGRCLRTRQHVELKDALIACAYCYIDNNGCFTYDTIVAKARQLRQQLDITDFDYSQVWVYRVLLRSGLNLHRRVGDAASANLASVELAHVAIPLFSPMGVPMLAARPEVIFNCDETGLVYGAQPQKSLAFGADAGKQRAMQCVTVICCNFIGTKKLKPVIVAEPNHPRCFGELINGYLLDVERYMQYFNNQAA